MAQIKIRTTGVLYRGNFPDAEGQACQWAIDDLSSNENVGREERYSPLNLYSYSQYASSTPSL